MLEDGPTGCMVRFHYSIYRKFEILKFLNGLLYLSFTVLKQK